MTNFKPGDRVAVADYLGEHVTWFAAGTLVAAETETCGPIVDTDYNYVEGVPETERVTFEIGAKLFPETEAPGRTIVLYHRAANEGEDEIYLNRCADGAIELWVNACIVYDSRD